MITILDKRGEGEFDRKLEMSDWRFSAAVLGMKRYFDETVDKKEFKVDKDMLYYKNEFVEGENADTKYFEYVEKIFYKEMHHKRIEELLEKKALDAKDVEEINKKLTANSIMKKMFKGIKYNEDTKDMIVKKINDNRIELIKETYIDMLSGYKNYANPNLLRSKVGNISRLSGYNVDKDRKTKTISYNFDFSNYNGQDAVEFDFIPFAFTKGVESIFINNNYTIDELEN